jgi:hypothetical protein
VLCTCGHQRLPGHLTCTSICTHHFLVPTEIAWIMRRLDCVFFSYAIDTFDLKTMPLLIKRFVWRNSLLWPHGLRRRYTAALACRDLGFVSLRRLENLPIVCVACCTVRGLWDGPMSRPGGLYRVCVCVCVCLYVSLSVIRCSNN